LKLDAGRIFAGLVGQSESNLRSVIQTAEAIAPCCLWIEELEKGFAGSKSSGATDGGTSARVFGSLISWMQEKKSRVLLTPHPPCQPASIPGSASIQLLQGWRLVRRSLEEGGCAPISSHRLDSTPN
jgi:hypothetical protein